ncbi:MAG TPA: hypothetical protein VEC38_02170, partial [Candidatus Binataceae bacterium]|nr:hypothetical protein [Candidatus Binataceae bacterium]
RGRGGRRPAGRTGTPAGYRREASAPAEGLSGIPASGTLAGLSASPALLRGQVICGYDQRRLQFSALPAAESMWDYDIGRDGLRPARLTIREASPHPRR